MSLRVMVVDTDPTSLKLIRSLASELGHAVFVSEDYEAAGQRGESQRFDVVFLGMKSESCSCITPGPSCTEAGPFGERDIYRLPLFDNTCFASSAYSLQS